MLENAPSSDCAIVYDYHTSCFKPVMLLVLCLHAVVLYLVGYERGDPVLSPVGVDEDIVLPPHCFGPCPCCYRLLEGLVQELRAHVQIERLDRWLSAFTVHIYLKWTRLDDKKEEDELNESACTGCVWVCVYEITSTSSSVRL